MLCTFHRHSPRRSLIVVVSALYPITFMSNNAPKYWYACVGEPVALYAPETGRCERLIIESRDPSLAEDDIKDEIRTFVKFPADTTMRWYEFKASETKEPDGPACAHRTQRVRIWRVAEDPAGSSSA